MQKTNCNVDLLLTSCSDGDERPKEGISSSHEDCDVRSEQRDDNESESNNSQSQYDNEGEFVIHRKLLRRRHICKERRERREEEQRRKDAVLKRRYLECSMMMKQTKRARLDHLPSESSMDDLPTAFPLTLGAKLWPRHEANEPSQSSPSKC